MNLKMQEKAQTIIFKFSNLRIFKFAFRFSENCEDLDHKSGENENWSDSNPGRAVNLAWIKYVGVFTFSTAHQK